MRIITGKAKGIILKTLSGDATRPTTDRVKEAVFSMLQFDIEDRTILDLFAGSGQMGLEALSRGASKAVFVDKSNDAVKIIKENVTKTKFNDNATVIQSDYIDFIKRNQGMQFDIIIIDPPYAQKMYNPALKALLNVNMIKKTTLIVCESGNVDFLDGDIKLKSQFDIVKQSKYSNTFITVLKLRSED